MHELVRDLLPAPALAPRLVRLPLDDGALIAAFAPRAEAPLWVAKTAYGAAACLRLRAEAEALGRLVALAHTLNLPRRLAWRECGDGPEISACLVQSTVAGTRRLWCLSSARPWARLPPLLEAAADWLRRFQRLAQVDALGLAPLRLGELAEQTWLCLLNDRRLHPEWRPLLEALPALPRVAPHLPTTATHGDFWVGNLLWQPPWRVGVVDWSGLSAGSALDDLLTFTSNPPRRPAEPARPRLACWQAMWFSPGRPREFLRSWARDAGYSEGDARSAFYIFLFRRMRWELGLGLQTRSRDDRLQAAREWLAIVHWLAEHRFPDPFTPMPV